MGPFALGRPGPAGAATSTGASAAAGTTPEVVGQQDRARRSLATPRRLRRRRRPRRYARHERQEECPGHSRPRPARGLDAHRDDAHPDDADRDCGEAAHADRCATDASRVAAEGPRARSAEEATLENAGAEPREEVEAHSHSTSGTAGRDGFRASADLELAATVPNTPLRVLLAAERQARDCSADRQAALCASETLPLRPRPLPVARRRA